MDRRVVPYCMRGSLSEEEYDRMLELARDAEDDFDDRDTCGLLEDY